MFGFYHPNIYGIHGFSPFFFHNSLSHVNFTHTKLTGSYDTGKSYKTLAELTTAMATGIASLAPSDGAIATSDTVDLLWTWDFEAAAEGTGQTDISDTTLGIGGTASVELEVTVTVTQADEYTAVP